MRGPVNTPITLTIVRKGMDDPFDVKIVRDVIRINAVKSHAERDIAYIKVTTFNEQTHANLVKAIENAQEVDRQEPQGLRHRPAQQSGRPARSGDRRLRRLPRARRHRPDQGPQQRGNAARPGPSWRSHRRQEGRRADQRRLGLGVRDRRRRPAGPQARDRHRHALVRQGLGADHHPARCQRCDPPDDGALLHAVEPLDPGQGHRSGHRHRAGAARRAEGEGCAAEKPRGEASLRGHLKQPGRHGNERGRQGGKETPDHRPTCPRSRRRTRSCSTRCRSCAARRRTAERPAPRMPAPTTSRRPPTPRKRRTNRFASATGASRCT